MPTRPAQDSLVVTPEDFKRLGVDLELISSKLAGLRSRGGEDHTRSGKMEPILYVLDKLVRSSTVNLNVRIGSFGVLSELCLAHAITPDACVLSDKTDFKIDRALYKPNDRTNPPAGGTGGQSADWVSVKLLRLHSRSQAKLVVIKQRFYHESARWKRISHPNLNPVLEVSDACFRGRISFSVITPWMRNGNVTEYLHKHRGTNRLELLAQAAFGLEHLHSSGIIHGGINPGNILVNENGQACLGDFGIAQITTNPSATGSERTISSQPNACRYMPPELLHSDYDRCSYSDAGDIYSLAITAFEILTDIVPYEGFGEETIRFRILNGERPGRPTNTAEARWISEPLWEMLEDCWNGESELRWEARCMHHRFSNPTTARAQGMPCVGGALRPVGFAVQFDQLQVDDCPKYLTQHLGFALKERQIYKQRGLNPDTHTEGVKALLEVFDKVLGYRPFDPLISRRFRQLCGCSELVPISYTIPGEQITTVEKYPIATGGFGDVWKCAYNGRRVAVKALRVYKNEDMHKVKRAFYKEVTMWKRLSHPNIVPFLGVTDTPAPLSMVLEWMPNGHVRDYVGKHPEADRLQLLLDICHGLQVLHTHDIVHGDLKGDNILVNSSGWACLTDFGFSAIANLSCTETSAHGQGVSYRWSAPELFSMTETKPSLPTKESDIYSFAMVTLEVFTGLIPFASCKASTLAMVKAISGERPTRPDAAKLGLTDDLWDLIQSAWVEDVQKRPPVETIVDFLTRAI